MIIVNAIKCPKCADIIYSRARHDFRSCSCGNIYIDGGFDYIRTGIRSEITKLDNVITFKLKVDATKKELYMDWNFGIDKYGLIKTRLKTVQEYEREWYKKLPLREKIVYKFWSIFWYFEIRLQTARNLRIIRKLKRLLNIK